MAQDDLDSLWLTWQDATLHDTTRIDAYYKLIWRRYMYSQPDSALHHAKACLDKAIESEHLGVMGDAYYVFANAHYYLSNYSDAMSAFIRSLECFTELKDTLSTGRPLLMIGAVLSDQGQSAKALQYYERAEKVFKDFDSQRNLVYTYNNISVLYARDGDLENSSRYLREGISMLEEQQDSSNLMVILANLASDLLDMGQDEEGYRYAQRALELSKSQNNLYEQSRCLSILADYHTDRREYDKSLEYRLQALELIENKGYQRSEANQKNHIGNLYLLMDQPANAVTWCRRALSEHEEVGAFLGQRNGCDCLYKAYKALGNARQALIYHEQREAWNDSLNAEDATNKLLQMEFSKQLLADSLKSEQEKIATANAHQIELRKKEQSRNLFLASGILLLLVSGGLYNRMLFVRRSREKLAAEKARSDSLLLNILPAQIAEELKVKGHAQVRDYDLATILFTDFQDFTQASSAMSASELVDEINTCFKAFDAIVDKYSIEKIKTIGDAYMAAGGLPSPSPDAVVRTVMAALDMQQFIVTRKNERDRAGELGFAMRVGIHTGPVVAGIVGVKKFQYDVWGDTVNTASRMESNGVEGKVNISQATYELLKNDERFAFEARGHVDVKGKGEIQMYFVEYAQGNAAGGS